MYPTLLKLGPFNIYTYGFMLALAFFTAGHLAASAGRRNNIEPNTIWDACFIIIIFGIIGARLAYIVLNLGYFLADPKEIFMLSHGGLVWYGGLIFGIAAGLIYLKKKKIHAFSFADLIAPFVALAQAIGRIGCFANGCCYGQPACWGIYFPVHHEVLIPTQLISSLALVGIFLILRIQQARPHKTGQIFLTYLILYSTKRFFIEFWRADSPEIFLGLTGFQIFSLAIMVISGLFFIRRK